MPLFNISGYFLGWLRKTTKNFRTVFFTAEIRTRNTSQKRYSLSQLGRCILHKSGHVSLNKCVRTTQNIHFPVNPTRDGTLTTHKVVTFSNLQARFINGNNVWSSEVESANTVPVDCYKVVSVCVYVWCVCVWCGVVCVCVWCVCVWCVCVCLCVI